MFLHALSPSSEPESCPLAAGSCNAGTPGLALGWGLWVSIGKGSASQDGSGIASVVLLASFRESYKTAYAYHGVSVEVAVSMECAIAKPLFALVRLDQQEDSGLFRMQHRVEPRSPFAALQPFSSLPKAQARYIYSAWRLFSAQIGELHCRVRLPRSKCRTRELLYVVAVDTHASLRTCGSSIDFIMHSYSTRSST